MATRPVDSSEMITLSNGKKVSLAQLEAIFDKMEGRAPGFYQEELDGDQKKWNAAVYTRVIGPGNAIVWKVSKSSGYISCLPNLRFNKQKKPIPGFGGDEAQWDTYHKYFRGDDYKNDYLTMRAISRKVKGQTGKGRRKSKSAG